jgi:hypothetical protein
MARDEERRTKGIPIRISLSNLRFPGLDGPDLYDRMADHRPHLCGRTAFVTADTSALAPHCIISWLAPRGRFWRILSVPAQVGKLLTRLMPDVT